MEHPTDEEFRATGRTGNARNHPLTEEGFLYLCMFNGIHPSKAPRTFRYASNAYMKEVLDRKGAETFGNQN